MIAHNNSSLETLGWRSFNNCGHLLECCWQFLPARNYVVIQCFQ